MATGSVPDATSAIRLDPAPRSGWPLRRWLIALLVAAVMVLATAIPTDLIDTPFFARDVPPTWWAWPVTLISSALAGLVAATYLRRPGDRENPAEADSATPDRPVLGALGAVGTWFAVGCPVCNKVALLALGYAGALRFFGPVQGYLGIASIALLTVALVLRVRRERSCPRPAGRVA